MSSMKELLRHPALRVLILAASLLAVGRAPAVGPPQGVADPRELSFTIRFGLDGRPGADWSGSISPAPRALAGWQFGAADRAEASEWRCVSRSERYWDTPYEARMQPTSTREKVTVKGIRVAYPAGQSGAIRVRTAQGEFSFVPGESLWLAPVRFLDGRVEVSAAPASYALSSDTDAEDYPSLIEAADRSLWLAYQSWSSGADRIVVRRRAGGVWSEPRELASGGDYFRTAMAQDRAGRIWVVWSGRDGANFDLYGRSFDGRAWSAAERLTSAEGSDVFHRLARGPNGNLYLVYQSSRAGNFDIFLRTWDGRRWSPEVRVSTDPANDWEPAVAVAPDGAVTVVWDTYARGNYDVVARTYRHEVGGEVLPIAASPSFEARASAQYDRDGRLWVAWEEGDASWGKDYGNLIPESGRGLMVRRQARVAVLDRGRLVEPRAPAAQALASDLQQAFQQPHLLLDAGGMPFLFVRYRVNLPQNLPQQSGENSYRGSWRLGATSYRGSGWSPMIEIPSSTGRIDAPVAATATRDGSIEAVWPSDVRAWPVGFPGRQDLFAASIPRLLAGNSPEWKAVEAPLGPPASSHAREAEDVARVRAYRTETPGRWRIARGDVHRHTDLSWDGNRDGSLWDAYRYALDAAAFDYLGVCDHYAGQAIPYHWWLIQKAADIFTIAERFAPLYSYERSLPFPNGHRNVLFAERGRPVLVASTAEEKGEEGAAKLYAYLRRFGGITTAHTTATGAGTDWRDNDAEVEPVVEIYQGYRNNYETEEGPRRAEAGERNRYAAGLVSNAWSKGFWLGVQSSSDHVSTHISYAAAYVERLTRGAILDAFRARRTYAATDNLIVDWRMGDRFMGERVRSTEGAAFKAFVRGTAPIARLAVIRNDRVIHTARGSGTEVSLTFADTSPEPKAYYYIRVEQEDGQLAWSSPIWVERQ
jgi:hypothetical protein